MKPSNKLCRTCKAEKPLSAFERYRTICRACRNEHRRVAVPKPRSITPAVARFLALVDRGWPDECWPWQGGRIGNYGKFQADGEHLAHRFSYKTFVGEIPAGMNVNHSCDFTLCTNPAHLWTGSQKANVHDCRAKSRNDRKLEIDHVIEMRRLRREEKLEFAVIAARFRVSTACARHAVVGRTWGHI